jgi:hypothetical protein
MLVSFGFTINQALSISVFGITFVIYGTCPLFEFRRLLRFRAGGIADKVTFRIF